jgi:hypothetical protein
MRFACQNSSAARQGLFIQKRRDTLSAVKPGQKTDGPREETRKKMRPVRRDEFNALVQRAIQTPAKKPSGKMAQPDSTEKA